MAQQSLKLPPRSRSTRKKTTPEKRSTSEKKTSNSTRRRRSSSTAQAAPKKKAPSSTKEKAPAGKRKVKVKRHSVKAHGRDFDPKKLPPRRKDGKWKKKR